MNSGTRRRSLALGVAVIASTLLAAGCSSGSGSASGSGGAASGGGSGGSFTGSPVVIGEEVCQTGYLSASDAPLADGAKIAVADLNKAGGILHHQVQLQTVDTQCVASNEITLAESLIEKQHASAVIGGYQSAAVSGVLPIMKQAKTPFIAAGTLPLEAPWGVTTFPPNTYPGLAFLPYLKDKLHAKSVGNITGDTPYGTALQASVTTEATSMGLTTKNVEIPVSATTTTAVLQKVAGTDAFFSNTAGPVNIIMAKDAANLGLKIPFVVYDPGNCLKIAAAYQPTLCQIPQAQLYPNIANAGIKANVGPLLSTYKASGGEIINFGSVTAGWDQVELIAHAMEKAGATDGAAVNTALSGLDFVGAQTEYKFTPGHTFGAGNPYVLTSTENQTETVIFQPAGAS